MESHDVAIVGLGATLPGAFDPETFWADQVAGRHQIAKLPREIWDVDRLLDPTRKRPDRPYSGIGAVVRGMRFDPREFAMPPRIARDIDPCQQAALLTARQALADAGIHGPTNGIRAAVLIGNVQGGSQVRGEGWFRVAQPLLEETISDLPSFRELPPSHRARVLDELRAKWRDQYPTVSGDSLPGLLGNLIAARIAHFYNFRGPAIAIDAACASSLVAIEQAVHGLRANRFDLAVAGGVDFQMDAPTYVGFCAMGALSADGSYPFDRRANGFVMGEGAVTFVMKRLSDALRDGDLVYAVIHGVGVSSDGRGRALVAPSVEGQVRAIREAWHDARRAPESLGYVEAHGTATMIGDPVEVAAMREAFGPLAQGSIPMGSVKANLGHLKAAAGAVGMLRAVLALHEGVVPPQAGFETPNPRCKLDATPMRLPRAPEDFGRDKNTAAVSAFGFGGINAHIVLGRAPERATSSSRARVHAEPPLGLGIIAFGASSRDGLRPVAKRLHATITDPESLARTPASGPAVRNERHRVAFYAKDVVTVRRALDALLDVLDGKGSEKRLEAMGITLAVGVPHAADSVAFMFPGQGSQYVTMLDAFRHRFPVVQATLDEADAIMASVLPRPLSSYISPAPDEDAGESFRALCRTEVLQPAMLACDEALRRLIAPLLSPGVVLGHSLGEYGACVASGVLGFEDALRIVAVRGDATSRVSIDDDGLMLGVSADEATVRRHIASVEGYVDVVNKNCPTQTILGGASGAVRAADACLRAAGLETLYLPVSHAFHSRIVAPVSPLLREALQPLAVRAPRVPILSNVTAGYYPTGEHAPDVIRDLLAEQVASPVEFIGMIERAYADGIRVFVEVGPKRAQAGFVSDILKGKAHRAVYLCHQKLGELETFGRAIAALVAEGVVGYGDPRRRRVESATEIAWRPPYVPCEEGTPVVLTASALNTQEVAPSREAPVAAVAPAARDAGAFAAFDDVAGDPRFWQFVATQAPALAGFVSASFRAAAKVDVVQTPRSVVEQQPSEAAYTQTLSRVAGALHASPSPIVRPPSLPVVKLLVTEPEGARARLIEAKPSTLDPRTLRSEAELTPWVLARVAEVTGYTSEELLLDADFESELGIDSIRQIEVVIDIRDALGLDTDDAFRMSDYPTLRSLIGYLGKRAGLTHVEPATPIAPTPSVPTPSVPSRIGLAAPEEVSRAGRPANVSEWVLSRVAEKTGYSRDELSLDADLESELGIDSILQIEIVLDVRDKLGLPVDDAFKMSDYPTLRALIGYIDKRLEENARPFDEARPADAAPGGDELLALPYFAHHVVLEPALPCGTRGARTPILVLHAGAEQGAIDAFGGAAIEAYDHATEETLVARLREHAPRTLVDLRALGRSGDDPVVGATSATTSVFRLARALLAASSPIERVLVVTCIDGALGFDHDARSIAARAAAGAAIGAWKSFAREWRDMGRTSFELTIVDTDRHVPFRDVASEMAPGGSFELALGGGHRRTPVLRPLSLAGTPLEDGSIVVVIGGGRGVTALIAESLAKRTRCRLVLVGRTHLREATTTPPNETRKRARDVLGATASISEVNALTVVLDREHELARTLRGMRDEGIDVSYEEADATDAASLSAVLASIKARHGRIDLVLHGAGIDRSRSIEAKDEAEIATVIAPKVGPLAALVAEASEARWVVLSSVSARFGNAGQLDYAAANEALAKACLGHGGLVLDFSAWAEVGMAAPLARALAGRGVDLLAPGPTAHWAAAAIAEGRSGEWVVAGRIASAPQPVLGAKVASLIPATSVEHVARLELESLAYLRDHRVRTSGVLPGVVAIAALTQAACSLEPGLVSVGLRDVTFETPLKVFAQRPVDVRIRAERVRVAEGALLVHASTWTESTLHHQCAVRLAPERAESPRERFEMPLEEGPDRDALYRMFFHGPSFQVVASTRLGDGVAFARSCALARPLGEDLPELARVTALSRELALQACGVYLQVHRRELALPVGVGAIDIHAEPVDGEVVEAFARLQRLDDEHRFFDVTTFGADGRVLDVLRDVRFRRLAKLDRD